MTIKTALRLFPMLFLPASVAVSQEEMIETSLQEIESSMEANLTWNLQNALLLYYPETKFVVKANVELQKLVPRHKLPKLPDALLSKELKNLPGLPVMPENLADPPVPDDRNSNLRNEIERNRYQVRRIRLNVLVDKSLSESDIRFVRRYVTLVANLNPKRGDAVRIEAYAFPVKADFEEKQQPASDGVTPPEPQKAPPSFDWRPYAFAAGLGVLLILVFLLGMRSLSRTLKENQKPAAEAAVMTARSQAIAADPQGEKPAQTNEIAALKSSLIDTIVGIPAASAKVFHRWVDNKDEDGVKDVAIVLASVSKPLVALVAPYMGQEMSEKVQHEIDMLADVEIAERAPGLLKQFDEDFRSLALETSKDAAENDELAFLQKMTDDQIQHLIKPLKVGVKAIVLVHVRANRAAKVMSKIAPETRKAVLAAMGNIERIPADVYQHISRQLAARAGELKKMRYVRANGLDSLVKVMEYLDDEAQEEAINYIQTQDVDLAKKVSEKFMTFNQLVAMPDDKFKDLVVDMDREALAKSLVSIEDETVERIINSLPDKLGELVRASLDANLDISEQEITEARRTLMRSVRGKHVKVI